MENRETNVTIILIGSWLGSVLTFRGKLISDLIESGHVVHVLVPISESHNLVRKELRDRGVAVHNLSMRRNVVSPVADFITVINILRVLREVKPDALLTYNLKPVIFGSLAATILRINNKVALITGLGSSLISSRIVAHHRNLQI